jgi:hypothetical protein
VTLALEILWEVEQIAALEALKASRGRGIMEAKRHDGERRYKYSYDSSCVL